VSTAHEYIWHFRWTKSMASVSSAIVCDRLQLYGNSSLLRSFAITWKPALGMKLRVTEKVMSNWLVHFWDTTLCDRIEHYTVRIDYNQDKKIVPVFCQQLCVFLGESQAFLCFSLNATEVFLLFESLPSFPCHLSPYRYARTKFFCWRFLAIFLLIMFRLYFTFWIYFWAQLIKTDACSLLGLSLKYSPFDH